MDRQTLSSRRYDDRDMPRHDDRTLASRRTKSGDTRRPLDWDEATMRMREGDTMASRRPIEWDEDSRRTAVREPSMYGGAGRDTRSVVSRQKSMGDARSTYTRDGGETMSGRHGSYDDSRTRLQGSRGVAPTARGRDAQTNMTRSPSVAPTARGREGGTMISRSPSLAPTSRSREDAQTMRSTRTGRSASTSRAGIRDRYDNAPPPLPPRAAETIATAKAESGGTMTPMTRNRDDRTLASRAPTHSKADTRSIATRQTKPKESSKPRAMQPLGGVNAGGGKSEPGYFSLHNLNWCDVAHPEHEHWRQDAIRRACVGDSIDRQGVYSNSSWLQQDIIAQAHRTRRDLVYERLKDCQHDFRKALRSLDETSTARKVMTISVTKGRGGSFSYESCAGSEVYGAEPNDVIVVGMHSDFTDGNERDGRHLWFGRVKSPKSNFLESEVKSHDKPMSIRNDKQSGPCQLSFTEALMHYVELFFDGPETGKCKVDIKLYHLGYLANSQ